ncbi:MAG: Eco47II family restriction endonuclease [Lachnospiraceae bacterium]
MKSIELFAGAGGLALGLEKSGFEHIGLVEFDKDAAATLKQNRKHWNVLCEDVEQVASRDLEKEFNIKKGELDLLSGGAPCQSFSYAGKRLGLEDTRGTMFYHYATFLHKLQPKMFLFENVRGLLTHDNGKTYTTILDIFRQEGYTVSYKIMNAWDYGVPQKRERLITIGIRNDLADTHIYRFPIKQQCKPVIGDIKLDVNPSKDECQAYSKAKADVFKLVPPGGYWRDIDPEVAKAYMKTCWDMCGGRTGILRRMSLEEPSLAVLTSPGMKQTDRCHPIEVRPFSYRENARLQTFPDDWEFCGTLAAKYKQVGNAVPVNLAMEIGKKIIECLEEKPMKNWPLSFITEANFRRIVYDTISKYDQILKPYTIKEFNSNLIDPIKLLFDKMVYDVDWEYIINDEIMRQRDKSNNNDIGYFHQRMFENISNCEVPHNGDKGGWDVIFTPDSPISVIPEDSKKLVSVVYVEMKNKHNTMNKSSGDDTFTKMNNQIALDNNCACFLVEAIAQKSQNIMWERQVKKITLSHPLIRRVSIDQFYAIVTGEKDAFYQICMTLPQIIKEEVEKSGITMPTDTVYAELKDIADKNCGGSIEKALYGLGFPTYTGFSSFSDKE